MAALLLAFLRIGCLFVGGGYAVIAIIQAVVVDQLHWLTPQEFVNGLAISQFTPGPLAMLSTFVGYKQAGLLGALVATVAIFTPSTGLMLVLSHGYQRFKELPWVDAAMKGVVPAVVGLVAAAGLKIALQEFAGARDVVVALIALVLLLRYKLNPAWLVVGGALTGYLLRW